MWSSAIRILRINFSLSPRNSTLCGIVVVMCPFDFKLVIMCSTNPVSGNRHSIIEPSYS
jgi:hypothetical protein